MICCATCSHSFCLRADAVLFSGELVGSELTSLEGYAEFKIYLDIHGQRSQSMSFDEPGTIDWYRG
jgi:hypothetical protein